MEVGHNNRESRIAEIMIGYQVMTRLRSQNHMEYVYEFTDFYKPVPLTGILTTVIFLFAFPFLTCK